jgi:hypothetical protein
VSAQTKSPIGQGTWIVGGSAAWIHSARTSFGDANSLSLNPSALYFFRPHFAFGGSIDVGRQTDDFQKSTVLGIGPDVRYYFGDLTGKTFPFLHAALRPSWLHSTTSNGGKNDQDRLQADVSAGLMQMIGTHVGLTGEVFYTRDNLENEDGSDFHLKSYGLRFGFAALIF